MTHTTTLERLDDYVGGELDAAQEREVRRHLMECESCRQEERELRALLEMAAALPEEIQPERDLWLDIAPRLGAREPGATTELHRSIQRRPARPLPGWMLAAASLALVITTAFATIVVTGGGRGNGPGTVAVDPAAAPVAANPRTALAAFRPAEREYERAIGDLQELLETRREQLAPATVATLEANLQTIDRAIAESRAALAADPNSRELMGMLSQAYDAKLDVLQRAVSL